MTRTFILARKSQIGRNVALVSTAICMLTLAGCGGGGDPGPQRYRVSGTVTYNGAPVPYGSIIFNPQATGLESGPQGNAEIIDGKYDTSAAYGTGSVGGPMEITVMGFAKKAVADGEDPGALFNAYTFVKELPKDTTTEDIVVPETAAIKAPKGKK